MRLSKEQLIALTGLKRKSAQIIWFRNKFGVELPCDKLGPVVSATSIEMLMQRKLGLLPSSNENPRPTIRLRVMEK